ncbi:unnamed protein product [Polarella glacialis]|uniref:Apple domain-containing protein n=1 Tax=Polarella glacialis TaxID=89957 RepID=A0A813GQM9_POLGL|nr:unnamed protein product [Polarella glacialis]
MTLEENVSSCQARCARIVGCQQFAFWRLVGHCHVLARGDLFQQDDPQQQNDPWKQQQQLEEEEKEGEEEEQQQQQNDPQQQQLQQQTPEINGIGHRRLQGSEPWSWQLWVSGPPGCQEDQISEATKILARRELSCYDHDAMYFPVLGFDDLASRLLPSALHCQRFCQTSQGCAHFSYSTIVGVCTLSPHGVPKMQPVRHYVCGPRDCSGKMSSAKAPQDLGSAFTAEEAANWDSLGAVLCVTALCMLMMLCCALSGEIRSACSRWHSFVCRLNGLDNRRLDFRDAAFTASKLHSNDEQEAGLTVQLYDSTTEAEDDTLEIICI